MNEKLKKVTEEFKKRTEKECYKVVVVDGEPEFLDDKIGGKPYLPIGEEYPKDTYGEYMPLLLQINLNKIDLENYPKEGILQIYTQNKIDYPFQYAIRYYKEGLEYQTDLPEIDSSNYIVTKSYKIKAIKDICHMTCLDYRFVDIIIDIISDLYNIDVHGILLNTEEIDEFFEDDGSWRWDMMNEITNHKITIGGYGDFIHADPREVIEFNKVEKLDKEEKQKYEYFKDKEECLFKLDSTIDLDKFNIVDEGVLFALISSEDIRECKFENAFVDLEYF